MYYVYVMRSINYSQQLYKGYTTSVIQRIKTHNKGADSHTAKFKPWKLIFYAGFIEKKQALEFEKYLKSASGIAFMRKRLLPKLAS
jgi:putative endonuclease